MTSTPTSTFTRPANTTAYVSGQLVANSTTAGAVVPLQWNADRSSNGSFLIRRFRLVKSGTTVTAATFRVHVYTTLPVPVNGDGAAWSTPNAGYIGSLDCDMSGANGRVFSDGAEVIGTPSVGSELAVRLGGTLPIYGLIEARGAYTPTSGEVFTGTPEMIAA